MKNRLEEIRKQHGIKQEELALALEVSRQTIGSLENGRYNPSIILAFKIARYFNLSIEEYLSMRRKIMKKNKMNYIITAIGILLLCLGLFLLKSTTDPQGVLKTLPYILVGIGCGTFGHGMGNVLNHRTLKNNPTLYKQQEDRKKTMNEILLLLTLPKRRLMI